MLFPTKGRKLSPCCFHTNGLSGYHTVDAITALASLAEQDALWPVERKEKGKEGKEYTF